LLLVINSCVIVILAMNKFLRYY